MNLGVLKSQGISWLAKEPLASQEGLNSIDLVCQLITEFVIFSKLHVTPTILNLVFFAINFIHIWDIVVEMKLAAGGCAVGYELSRAPRINHDYNETLL